MLKKKNEPIKYRIIVNECCKKTEQKNIRFGIKEIYLTYLNWCKKNEIKNILVANNFKEEFEKKDINMMKVKEKIKTIKVGKEDIIYY